VKPHPARSEPAGKRQLTRVTIERIISGGQTGADRAALDFAIEHGIPHGGWCPQGRLSEDRPIETSYTLRETPAGYYGQRTEWNVRDSDGTVIFSIAPALSGGSKTTQELAGRLGKPCLHLSRESDGEKAAGLLCRFVDRHGIRILNVAGPRSSNEPKVGAFVKKVLAGAIYGENTR